MLWLAAVASRFLTPLAGQARRFALYNVPAHSGRPVFICVYDNGYMASTGSNGPSHWSTRILSPS
jgi:hypothetical protein